MKILVTGAAGFLGSHLCRSLLSLGYSVIGIDNLSSGKKTNLKGLFLNPYFEFKVHDITEPFDFQVDQICNLACPASPSHYQANPVFTMRTAILGTLNCLELAKKRNIPIVQASTSEVYGNPKEHPQKESYVGHVNPIGPRACYEEGKRAAESLCFDYMRAYSLPVRVARIFNTYGVFMDPKDGRVIANFIVQALTNQSLTIYGDGSQTRSFCYVDDLIQAFIKLMNYDGVLAQPINLGNPQEYTIKALSELVLQLTESQASAQYMPWREDEPMQRNPDISFAKKLLNWEPKVDLLEGLKQTIPYFAEKLSLSPSYT